MTPKILKAGLLVGTLVFALVSCGQNTKPTENLKASYTFAVTDDRTKRFKISDEIKDKDNDSLTLSNFTSTNSAAWITLDSESKPTYIILNAATLPPEPGDQPGRAKVKFQVSDGTETITVSMDVIVHRPPYGCMILGGEAIVWRACDEGSVYKPIMIMGAATQGADDPFVYKYADFIDDVPDSPDYIGDPSIVGGATYVATATRVDCPANLGGGTNECFQIALPSSAAARVKTPDGVTVVLELKEQGPTNAEVDDKIEYVHVTVSYPS